jgi:hypothetical protein
MVIPRNNFVTDKASYYVIKQYSRKTVNVKRRFEKSKQQKFIIHLVMDIRKGGVIKLKFKIIFKYLIILSMF